jgi:ABC-type sugar transport system substrate-binding protein
MIRLIRRNEAAATPSRKPQAGWGAARGPVRQWPKARTSAIIGAFSLVLAAVMLLGSCAPHGEAVGDTARQRTTAIAHDSIDNSDVTIGLIGSADTNRDKRVLNALARSDLKASYVSTQQVKDPVRAAQEGVKDLALSPVSVILICGLDVRPAQISSWSRALGFVRSSGIPVVLIDAKRPPDDATLYAMSMTLDDADSSAVPLPGALMAVINDNPHVRSLTVTTNEQ